MITENVDLTNRNTLRTPGRARWLISVGLEGFSDTELDIIRNNPRMCLGAGSNTCFDGDFPGVLISCSDNSIERSGNIVTAGAGLGWDDFVAWTLSQNLFGLENLSLIPGTVGAAPVHNIGAYGKEVSEVINSITGIDLHTGKLRTLTPIECKFAYRTSIFKTELSNDFFITQVTFILSETAQINYGYETLAKELKDRNIENPTPKQVREAVIAVRKTKLPDWNNIPNAGSFFKNPIISKEKLAKLLVLYPDLPNWDNDNDTAKIPAAWLLETSGWKGRWIGNVGCYEKQPLVLITNGQATGKEIINFAHDIISSIKESFGITLEPEVNIICNATKIT